MGKIVILAEKPSQAKAYADAFSIKERSKAHIELKPDSTFPEGAFITWGIGHLVKLQQPHDYKSEWKKWSMEHLPILPSQFVEKVADGKTAQFNAVKKLFKDADLIVNGADVDREGSNIFYSILSVTGVKGKPIKRLWINSLEKEEVRKGFNNLQVNDKDLLMFDEAKARQISDWIVGINASRFFSLSMQQKGYQGSLSIGRVQSPTVYLIYQRQKEIENFVSKPFYQIEGKFEAENGEYKGLAKVKEEDKAKVQALLEKHQIDENTVTKGTIASVEKKQKKQKSPKLHSLSTLQTTANKRWKYSPSDVLKTMQELYLKKIVTYPRTDCNFITENEFAYLVKNVKAYQQLLYVNFESESLEPNKRYVDGSKVQEHYAIVPTKNIPSDSVLNGLSEMEKNIYHEIVATTLSMFHSDYVYEETTIITNVNELAFKSTGKTEVGKGWKSLFPTMADEKKENTTLLPEVKESESVNSDVSIKEGKTKPPSSYTEGQLINMMKTCGNSKLIDDEEDTEILKEVEGLGTEATRSGIIETIKAQKYIEVKKNVVSVTEKGKILCESIEGTLLSSPSMTAKWESYLQKIGNGKGSKDSFIKQTKEFIEKLIEETPQKLNNSSVDTLIKSEESSNHIAKCPSCQNGYLLDRKTFFGCSSYQDGCKVMFPKKLAGKTLSKTNIKMLCEKKKTSKIKGFQSKAGKTFEANLLLDKENKIKFDFPSKK
jgi:DNA topoisomerase-3